MTLPQVLKFIAGFLSLTSPVFFPVFENIPYNREATDKHVGDAIRSGKLPKRLLGLFRSKNYGSSRDKIYGKAQRAILPGGWSLVALVFQSKNDSMMVNAGRDFGLSRGARVYLTYDPSGFLTDVRTSGFLPKFENDSRGKGDEQAETEALPFESFTAFKKYSGSLGMAVVIRVNGVRYLIVTSKNDNSETEYVKMLRDLFVECASEELLREMEEFKLTVCFEGMCKDRVAEHAGFTYKNMCLVTTVAFVDPNAVEFQKFWELPKVREFGLKHGLGVSELYEVTGAVIIKEFFEALSMIRGTLTSDEFDSIAMMFATKYPKNFVIRPGNMKHGDVSGNLLEGVVMFGEWYDEETLVKRTVKWKVPAYTIRTMCVRAMLQAMFGRDNIVDGVRNGKIFPSHFSSEEFAKLLASDEKWTTRVLMWLEAWGLGDQTLKEFFWGFFLLVVKYAQYSDGCPFESAHIFLCDFASKQLEAEHGTLLTAWKLGHFKEKVPRLPGVKTPEELQAEKEAEIEADKAKGMAMTPEQLAKAKAEAKKAKAEAKKAKAEVAEARKKAEAAKHTTPRGVLFVE